MVFAGAKEVDLLDDYAKEFSIPKFDRGVNFWFIYPLTKPLFLALAKVTDWLRPSMGAYAFGAAIIVLTLIVKTILFPLQLRAYRSMAKMRTLQPKMKELQDKHADDRQALSQAMMTLYKQEGREPAGGLFADVAPVPGLHIALSRDAGNAGSATRALPGVDFGFVGERPHRFAGVVWPDPLEPGNHSVGCDPEHRYLADRLWPFHAGSAAHVACAV